LKAQDDPRLYPGVPLLAVSIALFRGDAVLLIKRAKPPLEGMFSLPGGLVEAGELLHDALRRELWEEVEMKAGELTFNRHLEMVERDTEGRVKRHFVVATFAGRWVSGDGRMNNEVSEMLWTGQSGLSGLALTPGLAGVLASARQLPI